MSGITNYPTFSSTFLNEFLNSLKKRSKSIKHKVASSHFQKVIEKSENETCEKLEIEFTLLRKTSVRLFVWEDRWSWIDIREFEKKNWIFEWQHEGRIGSCRPEDIVDALKTTFSYAVNHRTNDLDKLWRTIILNSDNWVTHE